jgi:hypothetical protein
MEVLETRQEFKQYKTNVVSIEQYFDPEFKNLGLEKYGMSMFDDGGLKVDLGYITIANKIRYKTGLDELSKEVTDIKDPTERDAKIQQIRKVIEFLETYFGKGTLDPTNIDFWSKINIEVRGRRKYLDLNDPQDLIYYYCIKGGGFPEIAPSYEEAKKNPTNIYKFYIQELEELANIEGERKLEINLAKSILHTTFTKEPSKLFKVAKVCLTADHQFTLTTPSLLIYNHLDDFIEGKTVRLNKKMTPSDFINATKLDKLTLNTKAIIIDAVYYKFITLKSDGYYYNLETGSLYGRTLEDLVEYMKQPLNSIELENIKARVEAKWKM